MSLAGLFILATLFARLFKFHKRCHTILKKSASKSLVRRTIGLFREQPWVNSCGLRSRAVGHLSTLQQGKVDYFYGEDPRGRANSLPSPLGRSLSSFTAGWGWGHL